MSAEDSSSRFKPEFSIRIVVCDYYLTKPLPGIDVIYSDFRGSDIKQVPVLRIFGPSPDGHKACLHIHGVFPYFYIPCPTSDPDPQFLYQIAASLDKALNIALKQATSSNQHVYKISLVKGLPFYGFHDKDHLYLKVFLYSPGLIKQAVELCSNGAILGQTFQPHESHLNFTLQFFIDFNLFGMSNIDLQSVKFRRTKFSQDSDESFKLSDDLTLKPESSCYYEADCVASNIINRQKIGKGDGIENPGLEEVWNQEIERRKQLNMSMSKTLSQGRMMFEETESHYKHEQICLIKLSNLLEKPVVITPNISKVKDIVYYPAESKEGSQLGNAVDISVHLPEKSLGESLSQTLKEMDGTILDDLDNTLVDENLALNSSLSMHYSQVLLDTEDLELVDILQGMDENPNTIEEDSVMGTPANDVDESDDVEYSQIYDGETILLDNNTGKDDDGSNTLSMWNDSFWDGANIPQLDGTFDDDHVKKVRKRKNRSLRLGLSKPKSKKKELLKQEKETECTSFNEDEINMSRETINISEPCLKKTIKSKEDLRNNVVDSCDVNNSTIMELVHKNNIKHENVQSGIAESYDLQKNYEPMAGPSNINNNFVNNETNDTNIFFLNCIQEKNHASQSLELLSNGNEKNMTDLITDCNNSSNIESSPEDKSGIISFYNKSKLFDLSIDENNTHHLNNSIDHLNSSLHISDIKLDNTNNSIQDLNCYKMEETSESVNSNIKSKKSRECLIQDQLIVPKIVTSKILTPKIKPPTSNYIVLNLEKYKIPKITNLHPFYSDHKDVGDKVEIGQMVLKLNSKLSRDQKLYEKVLDTTSVEEWRHLLFLQTNEMSQESSKPDSLRKLLAGNKACTLEPVKRPPNTNDIKEWLKKQCHTSLQSKRYQEDNISKNLDDLDNSQALGLNEDGFNKSFSLESSEKDKTDLNSSLQITMQLDGSFLCFGGTENYKDSSSIHTTIVDVNFLTLMLVEVHTEIREDFHPNPSLDAIKAIFIKVTNDCPSNHFLAKCITEIYVVDELPTPKYLDRCVFGIPVFYFNSESNLLEKVIELVHKHDPDIMCGYEIESNSWGYIIERSQILGVEIVREISRITEKHRQKRWRSDESFEGNIIGRVIFNVWRLFRHELALSSYSFENCMYEILKERVPKFSVTQLAEWWNDESRILRWIPVEYYLTKLSGTVRMLEKLDIINRTSELARLFGLQWWEVLSRGSQFRVESLMLRAARPLNLIALSPTVKQRATMRAPECLPLIFEPESRFYADPIVVLDFQSLYPSMMIAYNYCFSTCIGRVQNINGDAAYEFGAWCLRMNRSKLEALVKKGLVHWSPVGVGFVKATVRRGVLPSLLRRILAARQAVKKSMKMQTDENVKKAMHSRQLGLKLIANVTYGYTAANFSGRMPCVEVGDSVVAKGRETLERAIKLVRNNPKWNAKVVYGDTDSMFVQIPGGTRAEAFEIGQQIADAVTADNPSPVALKLEKVYQPCILQTKKRYVGFMYESPDQEDPIYEAKGIETVRRDGCPAGVKLLQQSLCELFKSGDMSRVKRNVLDTLSRLVEGSIPPQDLFFTREYHGTAGYRPGATAPPNEIAKRMASRDSRSAPRPGWRVSWQVTAGAPGAPLVKLARTPHELAKDPSLTPHVSYYAARVLLPPLHRCLSLLGVDVFKWWSELGYNKTVPRRERCRAGGIARYMARERCAACGERVTAHALCQQCADAPHSATPLIAGMATAQRDMYHCYRICETCCGNFQASQCENTECPVLWRRLATQKKCAQMQEVIANMPSKLNKHNLEFYTVLFI
ncbi:hypothetical protein K1T71_005725 [Dendrolimus kikuchii]|uniref:Uncharacterized protein n=1 Tax=Dendrolimus kikuchii TaxID=765133 RepID=A0ACC1D4Z7_9NEOP|nr:hypothetical protein K1T71_005725 [Dendrolimus kikuchii]